MRAPFAAVLAAAALALVPAAAVAQDASCSQYCDPLANNHKPPPTRSTGTGDGSSGRSPTSSSGTGTSPGTASASAAQPTQSSTTAAAPSKPGLPRTGFPVGWLMLAGALFSSGGLALRRVSGSLDT
jgi:LPXTG-motif cell wall-anchored protein